MGPEDERSLHARQAVEFGRQRAAQRGVEHAEGVEVVDAADLGRHGAAQVAERARRVKPQLSQVCAVADFGRQRAREKVLIKPCVPQRREPADFGRDGARERVLAKRHEALIVVKGVARIDVSHRSPTADLGRYRAGQMVDFDAEAPIQRREAAELRRQRAAQAVVDQGELVQRREAADFGRHATGERA